MRTDYEIASLKADLRDCREENEHLTNRVSELEETLSIQKSYAVNLSSCRSQYHRVICERDALREESSAVVAARDQAIRNFEHEKQAVQELFGIIRYLMKDNLETFKVECYE